MVNFFVINNLNGTNYHINKAIIEVINSKKKVVIFVPNEILSKYVMGQLDKKGISNKKYDIYLENRYGEFSLRHQVENYKIIFLFLGSDSFKKINIENLYDTECIAIVTEKVDSLISGSESSLYTIEFLDRIEHRKSEYEKNLERYLSKWGSKSKLRNEEIEEWLKDGLQIARERVYIQSPWFNDTFSKRFIYLLANSLSRGVKVKLFYGLGNDDRYDKTIETITVINAQLASLGDFEAVEVNSHAAEIIIDNYNLTSSQNIGSCIFGEWGEVGTLRRCTFTELEESIKAMYNMQKNMEV